MADMGKNASKPKKVKALKKKAISGDKDTKVQLSNLKLRSCE
jgi:hypothetical protein